MKTSTQVVVIGGGIAGCSALYHLTQEGISDCMLIERDELTSGTTWHSAAQVTNFGPNQTMVGLKTHSINLYKELAEDPEYPINYHHGTGGIRLARTQDHLDGYHHFVSMAKGMGVDFEVIDAQESQRRHPLIETHDLLGSLWDPLDGYIDPAQLCQALTQRARRAGAEVVRFNPVTDLTQKPDHSWIVHTEKGDITCETVVNAGGYRCNEIAAMMGTELPVASMEHQYMITDTIPEVAECEHPIPLIRCPTDDFYQRQEKDGLLIGFYEQDCKTWGVDGIDPNFSMDLCPDDLDRVTDVMEGAFKRMPCLQTAGIKSIVNGPITYTPDGLPLVGKVLGVRNAFCITGLRAGLGEGGGHGWLLAQLIVHGEACYDTWCLDPRRFTRYADTQHTALKAIEDYQNEFRFHMPHEHRPAGRDKKLSPLHDRLKGMGAVFTPINGWERADFYKPTPDFEEQHSFRFNNTHDVIAAEVANVQSNVGIMEVCGFNRFALSGAGVHDWLDGVMATKISRKPGKVGLAYFLNDLAGVKGECTLANLPSGQVWYGSAAAAEAHDMDWLTELLPDDGSVSVQSLTNTHTLLVLAGPKSRAVLETAAPEHGWDGQTFPWLQVREVQIAGIPVTAMSVSFSGELAWELHVKLEHAEGLYEALWQAGQAHGIKPFGLRATESMRMEKGYLGWKSDLITEFLPHETGLNRFVDTNKKFFGRNSLLAYQTEAPEKQLVSLEIACDFAGPHGGDSLYHGDEVVGTITSAGYGHRTGKNLAMAFVKPEFAKLGSTMEALYLGQRFIVTTIEACQYDPQNQRIRS